MEIKSGYTILAQVNLLGCCPSQRNQNKNDGCNEEANFWSTKYKEGLRSMLEGLKSELKDINYSYSDAYSIFINFIQTPATYGFTEVKAGMLWAGEPTSAGSLPAHFNLLL
ncbi:unnamed protein product [Ilex paraguariensis]|uniref:Uncharacterized protein n=1 Tax=Ilex paraguariensis TaxID=185542 RepID=A0ABC8R3Y7_9AQUA